MDWNFKEGYNGWVKVREGLLWKKAPHELALEWNEKSNYCTEQKSGHFRLENRWALAKHRGRMKTVCACSPWSFLYIFFLLLHTLEFLQLQLLGCKFIKQPLVFYTICSGNVLYVFSHLLGEGRIVLNEEKMESLKRNVLFSFLPLPLFPSSQMI